MDKNPKLDALLRRGDVWRGQTQNFVAQKTLNTGFTDLDKALLHKGWPLGALIEICQPNLKGYCEWLLLTPALKETEGHIALINPPTLPFVQKLIQNGIDLDRLLIVNTPDKNSFISSFVELARSRTCEALLAWQPKQSLSYTELRKCLLASTLNSSLYVFFRSKHVQQQSSPANLRITSEFHQTHLHIKIFKQKGLLIKNHQVLKLPLPNSWKEQYKKPKSKTMLLPFSLTKQS